jgi:hypothetical protein
MEMEENREVPENEHGGIAALMGANRWLLGAILALVVVAGLAFGYGLRQQIRAGHLAAQESVANATINDLQRQLNVVTDKLNSMAAAQQVPAPASAQRSAPAASQNGKVAGGAHLAAKQTTPADKRYKALMAQLEDQKKELKATQDLVAKNRSELEGSLNSTRDELNGSIAKTHEELVALAKRGERSYFEFDLEKSKQFQRFGPVTLSLRKADTKHKSFDLEMIVDDNQLSKKKVNLYEPIWIHTENESQPVQVVVNRIEKNRVHGYVSAPKYKPSELASKGAGVVTPVAGHPQGEEGNAASPKQPQ